MCGKARNFHLGREIFSAFLILLFLFFLIGQEISQFLLILGAQSFEDLIYILFVIVIQFAIQLAQ